MADLIPFVCPRCKAKPNAHGTVGRYAKSEHSWRREDYCEGVLCECEFDTGDGHGESFADPCQNAYCHCCGWGGRLPTMPRKALPWEKKALEAGWTPPAGWDAVSSGTAGGGR